MERLKMEGTLSLLLPWVQWGRHPGASFMKASISLETGQVPNNLNATPEPGPLAKGCAQSAIGPRE